MDFSTSAAKAWKENEAAMIDAASVGLSTFNMFHVPYVGDSLVLKSLIICSPNEVGRLASDELKVNKVLTRCL